MFDIFKKYTDLRHAVILVDIEEYNNNIFEKDTKYRYLNKV